MLCDKLSFGSFYGLDSLLLYLNWTLGCFNLISVIMLLTFDIENELLFLLWAFNLSQIVDTSGNLNLGVDFSKSQVLLQGCFVLVQDFWLLIE